MNVLLGGLKGGCGKTSLATNLAAYLAGRGADFALVDADRQRSAAKWAERRSGVVNPIFCPEKVGQGLYQFLVELEHRTPIVIVDAGGRDSVELRQALLAADVLYTPLTPSQLDIETLDELRETVRLAKAMNPVLDARVVLSMVELGRGKDELTDARETLADYADDMTLSGSIVCRRKVYRQAVREGFGVVESDNKLARLEIEALAQEIFGV